MDEKSRPVPPLAVAEEPRRLHGFALFSVLASLMLTLFLQALDQTVVGTALPKIVGVFHGFDRFTWVVTAYLLAVTTTIPIVGKLSDQFGRKVFSLSGVVIFVVGSVLAGASQSMNQLIVFRAVQGVGAGIGITIVIVIIADIFAPEERARWQGLFGAVFGISSVLGPTIGGWLSDHGPLLGNFVTDETRWRWIFYINLPLGIIAFAALWAYLPSNLSERSNDLRGWAAARRIDFPGVFLASGATITLLLALTWGGQQTYAWSSGLIVGLFVASASFLAAFVVAELRALEPIMPLDLFRDRVFSADSFLSVLVGMTLMALVIYLPLYLQNVLGLSATSSGALITPLTVSLVVGASTTGFVISKIRSYYWPALVGGILLTLGAFLFTRMSVDTSLSTAVRNMVIVGVGFGAFFPLLTLVAQNVLPKSRLGVGTGTITYFRSVGQVLGVAIVGTIVNASLADQLGRRVPADLGLVPPEALAVAIGRGFTAVLILCVGILVASTFLRRVQFGGPQPPSAS